MNPLFQKPFLTELDSRARIKGSRDPLGFQIIWTALGRRVIKNLTTVTTSPRNFTVLLLGYYFAQKLIQESNHEFEKFADYFLKFEQLAAYSRYSRSSETDFSEEEIRGILRVKRNLLEANKVAISVDQDAQILSNQKTYGIWGLYTVASRSSGLLEGNDYQLKPEVRQFIENNYLDYLPERGNSIIPFLEKRRSTFEPKVKDKKIAQGLSEILKGRLSKSENDFYTHHLIFGGDKNSDQAIVWNEIRSLNQKKYFDWSDPFSGNELLEIIKVFSKEGKDILAEKLDNIRVMESVIAPLSRLFNFIMGNDQREVKKLSDEIKKEWGRVFNTVNIGEFSSVAKTLNSVLADESINNLIELSNALHDADYGKAIELLIERNRLIMRDRGGSEWLHLKKGKIDVRFREEYGELPAKQELNNLWVHPYFINSLKILGYKIQRYHL